MRAVIKRSSELFARENAGLEPRRGLGRLDPELIAHTLIAAAEDAARLTLTHPRRFPPERLADFTAELLRAVAKTPSS